MTKDYVSIEPNGPVAVRIVKEAVNAIAGALHRAVSYADADQSQLTASLEDVRTARREFASKT